MGDFYFFLIIFSLFVEFCGFRQEGMRLFCLDNSFQCGFSFHILFDIWAVRRNLFFLKQK